VKVKPQFVRVEKTVFTPEFIEQWRERIKIFQGTEVWQVSGESKAVLQAAGILILMVVCMVAIVLIAR
jgi:hypothetical protein